MSTAESELTTAETALAAKEREQQIASDRLAAAQSSLETVKQESEASQKTASETSSSVAEIVVSTYQGDNSVTSWSYVLASQDVEELSQRASAVEIGSGVQEAVLSAAEVERAQNANREARQNAATTRVGTLKTEADTAEANAKTARDAAKTKRDEVAKLAAQKKSAAAALESRKSTSPVPARPGQRRCRCRCRASRPDRRRQPGCGQRRNHAVGPLELDRLRLPGKRVHRSPDHRSARGDLALRVPRSPGHRHRNRAPGGRLRRE